MKINKYQKFKPCYIKILEKYLIFDLINILYNYCRIYLNQNDMTHDTKYCGPLGIENKCYTYINKSIGDIICTGDDIITGLYYGDYNNCLLCINKYSHTNSIFIHSKNLPIISKPTIIATTTNCGIKRYYLNPYEVVHFIMYNSFCSAPIGSTNSNERYFMCSKNKCEAVYKEDQFGNAKKTIYLYHKKYCEDCFLSYKNKN